MLRTVCKPLIREEGKIEAAMASMRNIEPIERGRKVALVR
jgi:hypothetical protein